MLFNERVSLANSQWQFAIAWGSSRATNKARLSNFLLTRRMELLLIIDAVEDDTGMKCNAPDNDAALVV